MCILSGDGGWQVIGIDVEEKGRHNRSLWDTVLEASEGQGFVHIRQLH